MSTKNSTPTAKKVRALFDYNHETGLLTWRTRTGRAVAGSVAGTPSNDGYLQVAIDCEKYRLHRVVWLWYYGTWPKGGIKHSDGNVQNNRIANLQDLTRRVRTLSAKCYGESGIKGVSEQCGKYRARIFHPYLQKTVHIGTFETSGEAKDAFREKHAELHGIDSPYFDDYHQPHPAIVKFSAEFIKARASNNA